MIELLKWAYQSRTVWVSTATAAVTFLIVRFADWLGLTPDQALAVAGTVVALAVAVIGKLAAQNVAGQIVAGPEGDPLAKPDAAKSFKIPIFLLALLLLPLAGGCMAPAAVQQGQAAEAQAWAGYVSNVGRINDLTLSMYEIERRAAVESATKDAMRKVNAAAVDGKLPAAEFAGALEALVSEREKAAAQTATIVKKTRALIDANNLELAKALRLHGAMTDWLAAGIDSSAIPGLIEEAAALYQTFKPTPAKP